MKKMSNILLNCSVFAMLPVLANAAGTYYNGSTYQSPQSARYSQQSYSQRARTTSYSQSNGGYARGGNANGVYSNPNVRYGQSGRYGQAAYGRQDARPVNQEVAKSSAEEGFRLGAGISRQTSMWQFEMKDSCFNSLWGNLKYIKAAEFEIEGKKVPQEEVLFDNIKRVSS
ncbi:MAG: hypothetical protein II208_03880, partial [Alphaproteobacteria bacterium]|nr:hypothetical protein [Alphaproteobacteria bacterium]